MARKAVPESPEPERTGEIRRGHRQREAPSPAVLAVRLENLQRGYRAWRGGRMPRRPLEVAMAELPYEELWQRVKPRMTSAVLLYLLGYDSPTGERVGRAARDRDALTAAKLVFEVSGERIDRHAHLHLHILQDMTDSELEQLANTGQFPERFQAVQAMLPPDPEPSCLVQGPTSRPRY